VAGRRFVADLQSTEAIEFQADLNARQSMHQPSRSVRYTGRSIKARTDVMSNHTKAAIAGLLVAIPWGWYADISTGDYGWFLGRLLIVPALAYAISVAASKSSTQDKR